MNLLAIETATDACSVALQMHGKLYTDHREAPQQHAQLVLTMIDGLFVQAGAQAAELDGIAFGRGPGSFTGLRIAAAVTQGIAFGLDKPVVGVSTLQCLAQGVARQGSVQQVFVALDARMSEVYWGAFELDSTGLMQASIEEQVCAADAVQLPSFTESKSSAVTLLGSGSDVYLSQLQSVCEGLSVQHIPNQLPHASDLLPLAESQLKAGNGLSAEHAIPVYLRNRVALTEAARANGEKL